MNLDSLNDLTRHILEVMYSNLKIQKIGTSESTMVSQRILDTLVICNYGTLV